MSEEEPVGLAGPGQVGAGCGGAWLAGRGQRRRGRGRAY